MANKNIKAFFEKVFNDTVLQNELKALSGSEEEQLIAIIDLAKKHGCPFSKEDFLDIKSQGRNAIIEEFEEVEYAEYIKASEAQWRCGGGSNQGMWGCFPASWV